MNPLYFPIEAPKIDKVRGVTDLGIMLEAQAKLMRATGCEKVPPDLLLLLTLVNIIGEAQEALAFWTNVTKPWKDPGEIDIEHVKEELIDVLHFLLQAFVELDMTDNEVVDLYLQKNERNFERIKEKMSQRK